ncbi:MAG: hypothetical protein ACI3VQ_00235 [Faecousia sp.]
MKRNNEIRTVSFVRVGGELVRFDSLPQELRRKAATKLKTTYLNELYRGTAVFEANTKEETA